MQQASLNFEAARITNSSSRAAYTGNRMESPRDRANDHYLVDSVGMAC